MATVENTPAQIVQRLSPHVATVEHAAGSEASVDRGLLALVLGRAAVLDLLALELGRHADLALHAQMPWQSAPQRHVPYQWLRIL